MRAILRRRWPAAALVAFLALLALVGVAARLGLGAQPPAAAGGGSETLTTALEVVGVIKTHYIEPVGTLDLLAAYVRTGTVNGMLQQTLQDPYTRYLDPQAFRQMQIDTSGHYAGIGVYLGISEGRLTIIAPIPGTPAARVGLQAGDVIVAVNGRSAEQMSEDEAVSLIRGPKGTPVRLAIQRGGESLEVTVTRDEIDVPAVSTVQLLPDRIGYVHLLQFSEKAAPELDAALSRLEREGYEGLVLDLRNNPGGLLSAAVEVANLFFGDGPIVHIVGRDGRRQTINARPSGAHRVVPMVVLVNQFTASASEIVAGALRDRGLATLVGTATFGKGLVQTVVPLRSGGAVAVTTHKYQTVGGHFIGDEGIPPDVMVEAPADRRADFPSLDGTLRPDDVQLQKAVEVVARKAAEAAAQRRASGAAISGRAAPPWAAVQPTLREQAAAAA